MSDEIGLQLYKSQKNKVISGVSAGIADYLDVSPFLIRILFLLLTLANGIGAAIYFGLALLLPSESEVIEAAEIDFFEHITDGDYVPPAPENVNGKSSMIDEVIGKENILSFVIIFLGLIILQLDIHPWSLIPEVIRIPIIVILVGFSLIVKSLHISN